MEDRESMELQFLRQQALSTQKRRGVPVTSHNPLLVSPTPFPMDSGYHDIKQLFKSKKLPHKGRKSTPEIAQEVIDTFSSQARHNKRPLVAPSRSNTKHPKRMSSASSSPSSCSTSTRSRSRSQSSYSTSRSRSSSGSRSSTSSRTSSYSDSRSNSYTRSSVSRSSRSRSQSPAPRVKMNKAHSSLSYRSTKVNKSPEFRKRRSDSSKHRMKVASPDAVPTKKSSSSHQVYSVHERGSGSHSDWYHSSSSFHQRDQTAKSHSMGSGERRSRHPQVVPSSSDGYRHHRHHREAESRQHKSPPPPPPQSSRRHRTSDYLNDEEAYQQRSSSRHHHHPSSKDFSSPPLPPPPPQSSHSSSRSSLHHRSAVRSPHRHASPPRERRVIRHSPPFSSSSQRLHVSRDSSSQRLHVSRDSSSQRLHVSRDHLESHSSRRPLPPPSFQSPSKRRRRSSLSPPSLPPPLSSRSRKSDIPSSLDRSRDVSTRDRKFERRREDGGSGRRDERTNRSLDERDLRDSRRDQRLNGGRGVSQRASKHVHSDHHDKSLDAGRGSHLRDAKRSSRKLSPLSVVDSISPKKSNAKSDSPARGAKLDDKAAVKTMSERDLLGDYDFNPFVDMDEELDYDENIEEISVEPKVKTDSGNDAKETEQAMEVPSEKEAVEPSSASEESVESEKEIDPISPEDISSASDSDKNKVAISSPIRVTPERDRKRKSIRRHDSEKLSSKNGGNKLSVKERLFVSKKTIEEKRNALGCKNTDSLRPSLANRLGPSPGNHRGYSQRKSHSTRNHEVVTGSAMEIAEAYKKKRMEKLLRGEEMEKAKKMTKMINSQEERKTSSSGKRSSPLPKSEDKEKILDQRIDRIKQNNRALEKRKREIEKDKQLYG